MPTEDEERLKERLRQLNASLPTPPPQATAGQKAS